MYNKDVYQLKIKKGIDTVSYTDQGWLVKIPRHTDINECIIKIPLQFSDAIQAVDGINLKSLNIVETNYQFETRNASITLKFTNDFLNRWTMMKNTVEMPYILVEYKFEDFTFKEYAWHRL